MSWRDFIALAAVAAIVIAAAASDKPTVVCGVDVSVYDVLGKTRFFDNDKNLVVETVHLGYFPSTAKVMFFSIWREDGTVLSVIKFKDGEVVHLDDCAKQREDEFQAENAHHVERINPANVTRVFYRPTPEIET